MTITVYGAGAIGGVTGAALARAGHDVLLVDRAEDQVAAMNARGLTIEHRDDEAAGIRLEPFDEYDPADYRAAARGDDAARQRAMAITATHYRAHTKTKTGIWRDLVVRRRKTEVGALLGATVATAQGYGLAMPLTTGSSR